MHPGERIPAQEGVTAYLAHDHLHLHALLGELGRRVAIGRPAELRRAYRAFQRALERHVRLEEEILFPLFDVRVGIVGGPTALLRQEHQEILATLEGLEGAVQSRDAAAFHLARAAFEGIFAPHTAKEERFLYAAVDRLLSDKERAAVSARLLRS